MLITASLVLGAPSPSCDDLPALVASFERIAFPTGADAETLRVRAADTLIKTLDSGRTLFTDADATRLKAAIASADRCKGVESALQLARERSASNAEAARGLLDAAYKVDEDVVVSDGVGLFAQDESGRLLRVRQAIHVGVFDAQRSGRSPTEAKALVLKRYARLATTAAQRYNASTAASTYLDAFALAHNPHASYYTPQEYQEVKIAMGASLDGIGTGLRLADGYTYITSFTPGGPASRSELRVGDRIVAVAEDKAEPVLLEDLTIDEVVKLIRGKRGTRVRLSITRDGEKGMRDVVLARDAVALDAQRAKLELVAVQGAQKKTSVALISLTSLYENASAHVRTLLEEARAQGADAVVLDLRENSGGFVKEATKVAGLFIDRGTLFRLRDKADKTETYSDDDAGVAWSGPLVALVGPGTQSMAELCVGALVDYKRAVVVGALHTFGKGTVERYWAAGSGGDTGGYFKATSDMAFLPSGRSIQRTGVVSDIFLPSVDAENNEADLPFALAYRAIEPLLDPGINGSGANQWRVVHRPLIDQLAQRSRARIESSRDFKIIRDIRAERERRSAPKTIRELRSAPAKQVDIKALSRAVAIEAVAIAGDLATTAQETTATSAEPQQPLELLVQKSTSVFVAPLKCTRGLEKNVCALLTAFALSQVQSVKGLRATGLDDVAAVLTRDRQQQALGCNDVSCMAEIGGALGTDLILYGELGRVGSRFSITLSIVSSQSSQAAARTNALVNASEDAILDALPKLVGNLVASLNEPTR